MDRLDYVSLLRELRVITANSITREVLLRCQFAATRNVIKKTAFQVMLMVKIVLKWP